MSVPSEPQWFAMVEETTGSYAGRHVSAVMPAGNYEQAVELAQWLAFTHRPGHPALPKSRSVFRTGPNTWLVQVTGRTATFHFTVTLGSWVGSVEH